MSIESDDKLPAFRLRPFDPRRIYEERVQGRQILYLDHNIWIDLREGSTAEARDCRAACEASVRIGLAIFPMSFASVRETLQMKDRTARRRQAALLDTLSLGITLRAPSAVHRAEAQNAYRFVVHDELPSIGREYAFTRFPDHLGDGHLDFPAGWRASDVRRFLDEVYDSGRLSLSWLVDHTADDTYQVLPEKDDFGTKMDTRLKEQWTHFASGRKLDKARVLLEERTYLFNTHLRPVMTRMLVAEFGERGTNVITGSVERHGEGGPERLASLLRQAAPSLELLAQVFARRALDANRKAKPQDFWDVEHATVAPVYTDAFVTADRGLIALLSAKSEVPACSNNQTLRSMSELGDMVEGLRAGTTQT